MKLESGKAVQSGMTSWGLRTFPVWCCPLLLAAPDCCLSADTGAWFQLSSVERQQGLALFLELAEDHPGEWAYLQAAVHYTNTHQGRCAHTPHRPAQLAAGALPTGRSRPA